VIPEATFVTAHPGLDPVEELLEGLIRVIPLSMGLKGDP
jgi:hypothetical protein